MGEYPKTNVKTDCDVNFLKIINNTGNAPNCSSFKMKVAVEKLVGAQEAKIPEVWNLFEIQNNLEFKLLLKNKHSYNN